MVLTYKMCYINRYKIGDAWRPTVKSGSKKNTKESEPRLPEFGKYLAHARIDSGAGTQQQVAEAVTKLLKQQEDREKKVSQGLIAKYEKGDIDNPDHTILQALAKICRINYPVLVMHLVREKYRPHTGEWERGVDTQRWAAIEALVKADLRPAEAQDMAEDFARSRVALEKETHFVLDVLAMAKWQERFKNLREFWVIAPNFLDDHNDGIQDAVVKNLKRNVRYLYFIHDKDTPRFNVLKKKLEMRMGKPLGEQVQARELPRGEEGSDVWLGTFYIVANPDSSEEAVAYECIRKHGWTVLATRLDDYDTKKLISDWIGLTDESNRLPKQRREPMLSSVEGRKHDGEKRKRPEAI